MVSIDQRGSLEQYYKIELKVSIAVASSLYSSIPNLRSGGCQRFNMTKNTVKTLVLDKPTSAWAPALNGAETL